MCSSVFRIWSVGYFLFICFLTASLNKVKIEFLESLRRNTTKAIADTLEHSKGGGGEHASAVIGADFSRVLVLETACLLQQENFNIIKSHSRIMPLALYTFLRSIFEFIKTSCWIIASIDSSPGA